MAIKPVSEAPEGALIKMQGIVVEQVKGGTMVMFPGQNKAVKWQVTKGILVQVEE
jgi:hypothetical protein